MKREDVIGYIKSLEASHAVEEYIVNGWHVWPLLKIVTCWWWLEPAGMPASETGGKLARFPWLRNTRMYRVYRRLLNKRHQPDVAEAHRPCEHDAEHDDPHDAQRDVVILTLSQRRVSLDGKLYEIYSDPLVEQLNDMGMSTLVWELGEERYPRYSNSAWISSRMDAACSQLASTQPSQEEPEPEWFADYQEFANGVTGRTIAWRDMAPIIDDANRRASVFEQWLRKTGAHYLFVVNWYNPLVMAAIMAAKRCGIKTVEIQHGSQGKWHFAYSAWLRGPAKGFEVVPEVFWCWGNSTVEELRENNPAFSASSLVIAGGNLWLNRWRRDAQNAALAKGAESSAMHKTILVSLQLDVEPLLLDAIKASPASWQWLIRFHPAREKSRRVQEEQLFKQIGHPGIELVRANNSSLYQLLAESDAHVTGWSTCAIEALALGVTSITIGDVGRATFERILDRGLMLSAHTGAELVAKIEGAQRRGTEAAAVASMFASDEDARDALRVIIGDRHT